MSIVIKPFGNIGKYRVHQALMTNTSGHAVSVLDFGGVLRRWMVPDRNEKITNIGSGQKISTMNLYFFILVLERVTFSHFVSKKIQNFDSITFYI